MIRKIIFIITGMFLSIVFCFVLNFYIHQEKLLFKSKTLSESYRFSSPHNFEEIFLSADDGASLHALLYKTPSKNPKGVVVYFHGRGGNLAVYWNSVSDDFLKRDYDVLIMDYRGFGKSKGKLSEKALLSDAEKLYEYAAKYYEPQNIVLYGRSLGTGIAAYVASKHLSKVLILEAPYLSIIDMAYAKFPFLPKKMLDVFLKYPLHTDQWIEKTNSPIEIFHGTKDTLIPYYNSELLHTLGYKKNPLIHLNTIVDGTHDNLSNHIDYKKRLDILLR